MLRDLLNNLKAIFLVKNSKILAYSLGRSLKEAKEHLEKIKKFHKLEGRFSRMDEWLKDRILEFFNGTLDYSFIDFNLYRCSDVYKFLIKTRPGETITYSELAKRLKRSIFYVVKALKFNPFIILIPCHRVVSKKGIGGYTPLGKDFKKKLLSFELTLLDQ